MILITEKFYATSAIPYVNAAPHLGHALEFVQTDVLKRFHALIGKESFLVCGTDDNSLKNVQAAEKLGIPTQELCNINGQKFIDLMNKIGYSYDVLVRSSSKTQHMPSVYKLWNLCDKSGDIYKKKYRGLYCVGCEVFYKEDELTPEGLCFEHKTKPEVVEEENYFFRLSKYQKQLEEVIESGKLKIYPDSRKNEVLSFIRGGLEDFSVSRSVKRARGWGLPVPGDESQIIYVWFDALICYISGIGYGVNDELFNKWWPAEIQVIGKGIIKFHAIYWPAMLLSAGVPLQKGLFVHGYITVEGQKMSKSLGNIVDPNYLIDKYGSDELRYCLLSEISTFEDGDFSERVLIDKNNSELLANLGNLVNRTLVFLKNNFNGKIPAGKDLTPEDNQFLEGQKKLINQIAQDMNEAKINDSLKKVMNYSKNSNKYFQDNKPWELVKTDKVRANTVLWMLASQIKDLSILSKPFLPKTSSEIEKQLNVINGKWADLGIPLPVEHAIGDPKPLFRKMDQKEIDSAKKQTAEGSFEVTQRASSLGIKTAAAVVNVEKISNKNSILEKLSKEQYTVNDSGYVELHRKVKAPDQTSIRWLADLSAMNGTLPNINTLVDSYNIISLKYGIAAGAHDVSRLKGNVRIDICKGTEQFTELGGTSTSNVSAGEYAAMDEEKVICRLELKQCEQTKVTKDSKKVLLYYEGHKEHTQNEVNTALKEACDLIVNVCGGNYSIIWPQRKPDDVEFADLDLEVGEILSVEKHPNAEKLYVEQIKLSDGVRQIVSGVAQYYLPEELVGKKVIVVKNLKSADLRGVQSAGMILAAEGREHEPKKNGKGGALEIDVLEVLFADKSKVGEKIALVGQNSSPKAILTIKEIEKIKIEVINFEVISEGKRLTTQNESLKVINIKEGVVG